MICCGNVILKHTSGVTNLKLFIGIRRDENMDKKINTVSFEQGRVQADRKKTIEIYRISDYKD